MTVRRIQDEVYVLRTHPLGDADLIVTLLSEQHGKVRAVARSARTSRRRFGGVLEPLTRGRAAWSEKQGRELHRLDSVECVRSFAEMQSEPLRQSACAVLADVAAAFAHEGQSDPPAFRLLGAVLDAMEAGGSPRILLRYFEYWTLRVHGLLPDLSCCTVCGREIASAAIARVAAHGRILCDACPRAGNGAEKRLGPVDLGFLGDLRRLPPSKMPEDAPAARSGGSIEFLLRGTLEGFAERSFRTYRHFRCAESLLEPRESR